MNGQRAKFDREPILPNGAPYSVFDVTQGFVAQMVSNTCTTITVYTSIVESAKFSTMATVTKSAARRSAWSRAGRGEGNLFPATRRRQVHL